MVGGLAGTLLVGSPLMSVATAQGAEVLATSTTVGNTYGGITSQGLPVVVDMKANRRLIVRAAVVVELTCTSGTPGMSPDKFTRVPVSRSGKFNVSFGPATQRNDDGTTTDWQGSMKGALNSAKTRIVGTWVLAGVFHDAAGAVTDTCESGSVRWTAKQ